VRLTVGDVRIAHPLTVPTGAVPAVEVLPALQGLVDAMVAAAETRGVAEGQTISCAKGCAACCRQLIPVSRTEGEGLRALIEAMPAERKAAVTARFDAATAALAEAGQRDALLDPSRREGMTDRDLSLRYFALGLPCPFLEEESCSIYADRPLICREYLVTSPAELCAGPAQDGVAPLAVPKLSLAARGLDEESPDTDTTSQWFALALLMDGSRTRPRQAPTRRPGPAWVERFLKQMSR
jgi:Fe-S-cluster containining protein